MDPEIAALIPEPDAETLAALEDTLKRDGCLDPLAVWAEEGLLLDGHHRYEICRRHGISYTTHAIPLPSREDAIVWVIQHQLARRNLTLYQRAELALRMSDVLQKIGEARQKTGGGDRRSRKAKAVAADPTKPLLPNVAKAIGTGTDPNSDRWDTREQLAQNAGVGHSTIDRVRSIIEHGTPALQQAARSGELSVAAASELSQLSPEEQEKLVADGPVAAQRAAATRRAQRAPRRPASGAVDPMAILQQATRAVPDLERRAPFALYSLVQIWDEGLRAPGYGPGDCVSQLDRLTDEQRDLILRYLPPMQNWLKHAVEEVQAQVDPNKLAS
ncbi:MAG TPA: hypothetical protein PLO69_05250 [Gammaproteobacteria bacterium]|nr:hypothetical protein [Gammaproteobacteria bacterium]